jgi:hypothetical protein
MDRRSVTCRGPHLSVDQDEQLVVGGMSGSPIVSPDGRAIGLRQRRPFSGDPTTWPIVPRTFQVVVYQQYKPRTCSRINLNKPSASALPAPTIRRVFIARIVCHPTVYGDLFVEWFGMPAKCQKRTYVLVVFRTCAHPEHLARIQFFPIVLSRGGSRHHSRPLSFHLSLALQKPTRAAT